MILIDRKDKEALEKKDSLYQQRSGATHSLITDLYKESDKYYYQRDFSAPGMGRFDYELFKSLDGAVQEHVNKKDSKLIEPCGYKIKQIAYNFLAALTWILVVTLPQVSR